MTLPAGLTVLERGWLSSNNIVCIGSVATALVDSGYCTHAEQTVELVESVLGRRPLSLLVNTHLHSDHCGGNAALQLRHPALHTRIPPGQAQQVRAWSDFVAGVHDVGQACPLFSFDSVLEPGREVRLGDLDWQVHASPGHDIHSVILFEPQSRTLISADALWESGFGVVFEQIESGAGFDEVAATLDLIESLAPRIVIPGHGRVFSDAPKALAVARARLDGFVRDPAKHARHAAKVLVKFKLLELQQIGIPDLLAWAGDSRFFERLHALYLPELDAQAWIREIATDLARSGAARLESSVIFNQ